MASSQYHAQENLPPLRRVFRARDPGSGGIRRRDVLAASATFPCFPQCAACTPPKCVSRWVGQSQGRGENMRSKKLAGAFACLLLVLAAVAVAAAFGAFSSSTSSASGSPAKTEG